MDSALFIHFLFRFRRGGCVLFDWLIGSIDRPAPSRRSASATQGKRGALSIGNLVDAASLLVSGRFASGRGLSASRFE